MPKSLAEIRASKATGLPERTMQICLAGRLEADLADIDQKIAAVEAEADQLRPTDDGPSRPKRMGDKSRLQQLQAEADDLAAKADALIAEIEEHTVTVRFRAWETGRWRAWCLEHPARDDSRTDRVNMAGLCNGDDLIGALPEFVVDVDGEPDAVADWDVIADNAPPGALLHAARLVLELHETVVTPGKSRRSWLNDRRTANGSSSPKPSGSPSAG